MTVMRFNNSMKVYFFSSNLYRLAVDMDIHGYYAGIDPN